MRAPTYIRILVVFALAAAIAGCGMVATKTGFYRPVTQDLSAGNYKLAASKFEEVKGKFDSKDRFLYYVDSGALNHYAENFDSSNARLTLAESAAEDLFTKSISRAAASMVLNDNVLEYSGEDYEILYTNLIKALNYLSLNKFDDAFVEIRRADLKLDLLEQKYLGAAAILQQGETQDSTDSKIEYVPDKVRFSNDAFARYLSMHLYAADGKFDDARIDYDAFKNAFAAQPDIYNFEMPPVFYQSDSNAVLSVVGLVGLAPVKEALNLRIRTDKDLEQIQILYTDGKEMDTQFGILPFPVKADYYFKFAIPRLIVRPSPIARIQVSSGSQTVGELHLLEDVSRVAEETFKAKRSLIYLRSVARAVAKGLTTHQMKKKVDTGGVEGWLKKAAIDVGSDISENADLRCSHFLPGKIYVGDFEIKPGTYDLTIDFIDVTGHVIETQEVLRYQVKPGKFNLVDLFSISMPAN